MTPAAPDDPDPARGGSAFTAPVSALQEVSGMQYFARMLDKIRLNARGVLAPEYHANLGHGVDGWCLEYLHIDYAALRDRVLAGGADEDLLEWCFANGKRLNKTELMVWNQFVRKLGWNDFATRLLKKFKAAAGLSHRDDIQTMAEFLDADEGRNEGPGDASLQHLGPDA